MAFSRRGARTRGARRVSRLGLRGDTRRRLGRAAEHSGDPCLVGDLDRDLGGILGDGRDGTPRPASEHVLAALVQASRCRALVRPSFSARVATNGGLVVAHTAAGRSPSASDPPTISTTRRSSSPLTRAHGLPAGPIGALADEPDALALAAGGEAMALVSDGRVTRVLASPGGLASWRQIATEDGLATSAAGRSCGLVSLLAVGYAAGQGLIGAGCSRDGIVGIFASRRSAWRLVGPGFRSRCATRAPKCWACRRQLVACARSLESLSGAAPRSLRRARAATG